MIASHYLLAPLTQLTRIVGQEMGMTKQRPVSLQLTQTDTSPGSLSREGMTNVMESYDNMRQSASVFEKSRDVQ
jgi:hypothetical protein